MPKNSLYILKIDSTYCVENTFWFLAAKRQEKPDKYVEKNIAFCSNFSWKYIFNVPITPGKYISGDNTL